MPRRRNRRATSPAVTSKEVRRPKPRPLWLQALKRSWDNASWGDLFIFFMLFVAPILQWAWGILQRRLHPHAW